MHATDEIKAALRRDFPGWSIIPSRSGDQPWRWWATRNPPPGKISPQNVTAVDADTVEQLRARLREVAS